MGLNKPFSQACENNKRAILSVLEHALSDATWVLEIGSGTGQHSVYFAEKLPHLVWQTADLPEYHDAIRQWLGDARLANVRAPFALNVEFYDWHSAQYDAIFSANTLHIMGLDQVKIFVRNVAHALNAGGRFIAYGPFNYDGEYTSESNARFDQYLKQQNSVSAIRDFEQINALATEGGLKLAQDYAMPANNRLLVFESPSP